MAVHDRSRWAENYLTCQYVCLGSPVADYSSNGISVKILVLVRV